MASHMESDDDMDGRGDASNPVFQNAVDEDLIAFAIQDVVHNEPATEIHPSEAASIVAESEAGFLERTLESSEVLELHAQTGLDTQGNAAVASGMMPWQAPFSRLVLLNFTRHPQSFENILLNGEEVRELREALHLAGHDVRLPSGTWILVAAEDYAASKRAVVGMKLGRWHVVVSEEFEPVVTAAVRSGTNHRENVRVRHSQTLGYLGDEQVLVERTFLNVPATKLGSASVTNSTSAAHGSVNPRRFI